MTAARREGGAAMIPPADRADARMLRYGYTLDDIHDLARTALVGRRHPGMDPADAYEACWGTIVERLYAAPEGARPQPGWLVQDARDALSRAVRTNHRHYGIDHDRGTLPSFERYWQWHSAPAPGPEAAIVDRLTLAQILPRLSERGRQALETLAATGSVEAAASALGCSIGTLRVRIGRARGAFLELWHEHETPSRKWRVEVSYGPRQHEQATCRCIACVNRRRTSRPPSEDTRRLAARWPLAELVCSRRAELGLGREEIIGRMTQAAAAAGQMCASHPSMVVNIERRRLIPKPDNRRWLAVALELPPEQVDTVAHAQQRMLTAERAARGHAGITITAGKVVA